MLEAHGHVKAVCPPRCFSLDRLLRGAIRAKRHNSLHGLYEQTVADPLPGVIWYGVMTTTQVIDGIRGRAELRLGDRLEHVVDPEVANLERLLPHLLLVLSEVRKADIGAVCSSQIARWRVDRPSPQLTRADDQARERDAVRDVIREGECTPWPSWLLAAGEVIEDSLTFGAFCRFAANRSQSSHADCECDYEDDEIQG